LGIQLLYDAITFFTFLSDILVSPFSTDGTELYDMHDIVAVCPWMVVNSIQMC